MVFRFACISVFLVFTSVSAQSQNTWNKIIEELGKNFVSIEYYEEVNSSASTTNGNKIKRKLNGVLVDSSGLIMTASSIYKATLGFSGGPQFGSTTVPTDITVRFQSGKISDASFVGKDDDKHVAFIRINEPVETSKLSFEGNSDYKVGQDIFMVFQLAEQHKYSLMVLKKTINSIIYGPPKTILSDAQLSQNKFGVACNSEGSPIGIFYEQGAHYSFDYNPSLPTFVEIMLAESFNDLIKDPPKYEKKNTSRKKWLGVNMQPFTRELAKYFNVGDVEGILINTVLDESPAKKAGIKIGDVIIEINGIKIAAEANTDMQVFRNTVREFVGDRASVKIWRAGKILHLKVELAEVPISQYLADEVSNELLGFSAKELTKDIILAKKLSFDVNGVWISRVERAGWADLSGLNVGDLLLKVNSKDLQDLNQLKDLLQDFEMEKPEYISFFIKRRSETRFLFIRTNFN